MYAITMLRFKGNLMICKNVTPRGLGSNITQRHVMKKNSFDCDETNNNILVWPVPLAQVLPHPQGISCQISISQNWKIISIKNK
jgi:hypothetical protein